MASPDFEIEQPKQLSSKKLLRKYDTRDFSSLTIISVWIWKYLAPMTCFPYSWRMHSSSYLYLDRSYSYHCFTGFHLTILCITNIPFFWLHIFITVMWRNLVWPCSTFNHSGLNSSSASRGTLWWNAKEIMKKGEDGRRKESFLLLMSCYNNLTPPKRIP